MSLYKQQDISITTDISQLLGCATLVSYASYSEAPTLYLGILLWYVRTRMRVAFPVGYKLLHFYTHSYRFLGYSTFHG